MRQIQDFFTLKTGLKLLVIVIVVALLGVSNYTLTLPPQRVFSESGISFGIPLFITPGKVFEYDLNITYQSNHTRIYSTSNSTVIGLFSKPPTNTLTLWNNLSLWLGFDLNSTDNLFISVIGPSMVTGLRFPLPESAGRLSVLGIQLGGLGLYRILLQIAGGFNSEVGIWTWEVRHAVYARPQFDSGLETLSLAVIIAAAAPLGFYISSTRRSVHPT